MQWECNIRWLSDDGHYCDWVCVGRIKRCQWLLVTAGTCHARRLLWSSAISLPIAVCWVRLIIECTTTTVPPCCCCCCLSSNDQQMVAFGVLNIPTDRRTSTESMGPGCVCLTDWLVGWLVSSAHFLLDTFSLLLHLGPVHFRLVQLALTKYFHFECVNVNRKVPTNTERSCASVFSCLEAKWAAATARQLPSPIVRDNLY